MKTTLLIVTCFICCSASAQKNETIPINAMQLMSQTIRINPADSAMMHEKALLLSPIWLMPDAHAKIYTKAERDSIIERVNFYRNESKKN